ncbi:MAG: sigma-54 dependent transcriptional regulator [Kiritimatiellia bacterium]
MSQILVVDDEIAILSVLTQMLKTQGHEVTPALGGEKARELIQGQTFDLMISDIRMDPVDGMQVLEYARATRPLMAVIMLTGHATVDTAVKAMKQGAFDYATKPFKVDELLLTVQRALEFRRLSSENERLQAQLEARYGFENIIAESPSMRKLCEMVRRVAPTDQTVLIGGPSGSGKEVIAKAIHANSVRKKKAFVAVNCAALPENLLESELFGHVKGAFTGASSDKEGLFETAHEGTLFLDEIGAMPLSIQAKLLRVLQDREVRKVGGTKSVKVDVRIIAASNENLEDLIGKQRFRDDLFYRLSVIPLHVEGLRQRREDILPLVFHFLRQMYGAGQPIPALSPEAQLVLDSYPWPGNVRELENAVRHAATFASNGRIDVADLPARVTANAAIAHAGLAESGPAETFAGKSLKVFLRQKEEQYIAAALSHFKGDKEKASEALKVSLATLYRKMPEEKA